MPNASFQLNNLEVFKEASGVVTYGSGVPAGSVINTIVNTSTTQTTITSTTKGSGTPAGLAGTITPTSTSNKLLINVNLHWRNENADVGFGAEIHDGTSIVYTDATNQGWYANSDGTERPLRRYSFIAWITPASAGSAITYTVRIFKGTSGTLTTQHASNQSTIVIQEIQQ